MKRLEKILKITAAVCAVVLIMGTIGAIVGVSKAFNGDITSIIKDPTKLEYFDEGEKVVNSFEKNSVKNIDINADIGNVIIKENPELKEITVTSSHKKYTKMELVGGSLKLSLNDNRIAKLIDITKIFDIDSTNRSLVVELPKDFALENVKINVNVGEINITSGNYKNLDVEAKVGDMNISPGKYTLLNSLKVENKMGDTEITNLDAIVSEIENKMGTIKINLDNEINTNVNSLEVENKMGDVYINLKNIDRDIDISSKMGSIDLISKNQLSKDVSVSLKGSVGETQNNFKHGENKLNKPVKVSIDVSMGSANLGH